MKELEKTYNPAEIEDRLYDKWLKGKYFHAEVNRSNLKIAAIPIPENTVAAFAPPSSPARRTSAQAVPSG